MENKQEKKIKLPELIKMANRLQFIDSTRFSKI